MGTIENEMHRIDFQSIDREKETKDPILVSPAAGYHRSNSSAAAGETTASQERSGTHHHSAVYYPEEQIGFCGGKLAYTVISAWPAHTLSCIVYRMVCS